MNDRNKIINVRVNQNELIKIKSYLLDNLYKNCYDYDLIADKVLGIEIKKIEIKNIVNFVNMLNSKGLKINDIVKKANEQKYLEESAYDEVYELTKDVANILKEMTNNIYEKEIS